MNRLKYIFVLGFVFCIVFNANVASASITNKKWVTDQPLQYYDDGVYKGILTKYLAGGSYTPGDSRIETYDKEGRSNIKYECQKYPNGYYAWTEIERWRTDQQEPIPYDDGVYKGMLYRIPGESGYTIIYDNGSPNEKVGRCNSDSMVGKKHNRWRDYLGHWTGTVYKPAVDTRYYRYQGWVEAPVEDPSRDVRKPQSTDGQASGKAFWELRRTNEAQPSETYAEINFSIAGDHFATRNERQVLKLGSHAPIQKTGKITSTINAASVKNQNMQYEYSYEYTNYYRDNYRCVDSRADGCYEWVFVNTTPVWEKGQTFSLADNYKKGDKYIKLKMDHRQNDVIKRNSIEEILQEKLLVGRSDRWTNNSRSSQAYYEGFNKLTNHFKSKVNLKTQSTMIIKPDTLEYEVFLPSEIHKQSNFKPFKKGLINGQYFPVDVDPSLQEELANHSEHDLGDYALFLQQSTMKDKGLKSNKRNFELEFVSDHMFITADTGFMVSYPFAYELNRHFLYGEHKPTEQLVTDLTKRKMAQEYFKQTGQEYMDEIMYLDKDVSLDEWEKYQRYFIPVTPKSPLQTNTTYVNNILLNNAGLSDVTWQYGQEFLFEHWMFGSGHDEAWLIEQPDPRIPVDLKDTKRILIKHEDKFTILDLLQERPQKRIHEFRRMDKDWVDKMKGVVGDWNDQ